MSETVADRAEAQAMRDCRERIREYCLLRDMLGRAVQASCDVIAVHVVVPVQFGPERQERIRGRARQTAGEFGPDTVVRVEFTLGDRVAVSVPPVPGQRPTQRPLAEPTRRPAAQTPEPVARTLRSVPRQQANADGIQLSIDPGGGRAAWRYSLFNTDQWIPLARGVPSRPGHPVYSIPTYARWVPRGRLIELRRLDNRVVVRRFDFRCDYDISVDGVSLLPEEERVIAGGGSIEFSAAGAASSVLRYQIRREGPRS